ncbi:MAG: SoxR reducing system RseC family protein [Bacteroidales bacterium]|nr:SoxR reducing system RseC family protein [Bacteroidales bacterium]
MAKGTVAHKGRITAIDHEKTTVEIISESACASCHAASLCGMSEAKKKIVEVRTNPYVVYAVGEEVNVSLKATMGHKAVWMGYGVPLVVLIAGILIPTALGVAELASGLIGLGAVALYYVALRLLRDVLNNDYEFNISKI